MSKGTLFDLKADGHHTRWLTLHKSEFQAQSNVIPEAQKNQNKLWADW